MPRLVELLRILGDAPPRVSALWVMKNLVCEASTERKRDAMRCGAVRCGVCDGMSYACALIAASYSCLVTYLVRCLSSTHTFPHSSHLISRHSTRMLPNTRNRLTLCTPTKCCRIPEPRTGLRQKRMRHRLRVLCSYWYRSEAVYL